jgi:predicted dehydrogenase
MMNLNPTERDLGRSNFATAMDQLHGEQPCERPSTSRRGMTRRDFLMTAAAVPAAAGAVYFGYEKINGDPVRAGLIGSGDEGLILFTESNPEYVNYIAYSDIRPSQQKRAIEENTIHRQGFKARYGRDAANAIVERSKDYHNDYRKLLADPDIEMVVICLPLHLHAKVAIEAMQAGKHVLCEKLMARYVTNRWQTKDGQVHARSIAAAEEIPGCKQMIQAARKTGKLLAIGHQRHYSILYDASVDAIHQGLIGDIRHIRALWHRNNARPDGKGGFRDSWNRSIPKEDEALDVKKYGYLDKVVDGKVVRPALRELVNWRLFQRTGGGLMAELGSHQLDASSIFLGKVHPLFVSGVGGKYFYHDDREVEDHVYCSFEFPGKNYDPRKDARENDLVVVTYSSINTNSFEGYGECVMGTKGTMYVESEKDVLLYKEAGAGVKLESDGPPRSTHVKLVTAEGAAPQLDSAASPPPGGPSPAATRILGQAKVSKGYREEQEHFAYAIRNDLPNDVLRCRGEVALADAVIALTANLAMERQARIEFQKEWFDPDVLDEKGDPWLDPRVGGGTS